MKIFNYIIIGGGFSGLYILNKLFNNYSKNINGILLERNMFNGGKIRTEYSKKGEVVLEKGPWRFNEEHHKIKRLLKKLDLKYKLNSSSKSESIEYEFDICHNKKIKKSKKKNKIHRIPGISYLDTAILNSNKCNADKLNTFSKLPLVMDSTSKPYDINQDYTGKYYVLEKGLSEIIKCLETPVKNKIYSNSLVLNVKKTKKGLYEVYYQKRNNNDYSIHKIVSEYLIICVPPEETLNWSIVKENLLPLVHSVGTLPLHHIYAYSKDIKKIYDNSFYIKTNSELSQVISGDFDNNWFQISYSSGENAKYWNRIKLLKPNLFKKLLIQSLEKIGINIEITKIKSFYWDQAIHYWKPNYNFKINECMKNSIYPHPINLEKLFWGGEAFSTRQGWLEGCLETSDLVLDLFHKQYTNNIIFKTIKIKNNDEYVIIDNRYIDVKKWKKVHPGSTMAIQNHLYEDISELFRQIKHPEYSWAILYTLQKYWVKNNQFVIMN